jgi:naphthalene 1,2-dioxygenase ferredoxin component
MSTMNVPDPSEQSAWVDVAARDDLWEDAGQAVTVGEQELALFRVGDDVFATDAMCTHGLARLCEGYVEGHEVECPLHQGRFDLRTGAATCEPATQAVAVHPVRIVDGRVLVRRTAT